MEKKREHEEGAEELERAQWRGRGWRLEGGEEGAEGKGGRASARRSVAHEEGCRMGTMFMCMLA